MPSSRPIHLAALALAHADRPLRHSRRQRGTRRPFGHSVVPAGARGAARARRLRSHAHRGARRHESRPGRDRRLDGGHAHRSQAPLRAGECPGRAAVARRIGFGVVVPGPQELGDLEPDPSALRPHLLPRHESHQGVVPARRAVPLDGGFRGARARGRAERRHRRGNARALVPRADGGGCGVWRRRRPAVDGAGPHGNDREAADSGHSQALRVHDEHERAVRPRSPAADGGRRPSGCDGSRGRLRPGRASVGAAADAA